MRAFVSTNFFNERGTRADDIPPAHRKSEGHQIRIGERPNVKFIYGQKRNNQRGLRARRSSPGISRVIRRVCSKCAHHRSRERQLYFKRNATRILPMFLQECFNTSLWNRDNEASLYVPCFLSKYLFLFFYIYISSREKIWDEKFLFGRNEILMGEWKKIFWRKIGEISLYGAR